MLPSSLFLLAPVIYHIRVPPLAPTVEVLNLVCWKAAQAHAVCAVCFNFASQLQGCICASTDDSGNTQRSCYSFTAQQAWCAARYAVHTA